MIFDNELE